MQTQAITAYVPASRGNSGGRGGHSADQFCVVATQSGAIATKFTYRKNEEIYGEDEPSDYAYQVNQWCRSYLQASG